MDNSKELTFDEKIAMVAAGTMTAAEAAQDPNPNMAFTSFHGKDPGPKPGDADYVKKGRKSETEPDNVAEATARPSKASKKKPKDMVSTTGSNSPKKPSGNPHGGTAAPWGDDEVEFALERLAENPDMNMRALSELINAEFATKPLQVGNKLHQRGNRSLKGTLQHFSKRKPLLLERLAAQKDVNAPSMGWQQTGALTAPQDGAAEEGAKEGGDKGDEEQGDREEEADYAEE